MKNEKISCNNEHKYIINIHICFKIAGAVILFVESKNKYLLVLPLIQTFSWINHAHLELFLLFEEVQHALLSNHLIAVLYYSYLLNAEINKYWLKTAKINILDYWKDNSVVLWQYLHYQ